MRRDRTDMQTLMSFCGRRWRDEAHVMWVQTLLSPWTHHIWSRLHLFSERRVSCFVFFFPHLRVLWWLDSAGARRLTFTFHGYCVDGAGRKIACFGKENTLSFFSQWRRAAAVIPRDDYGPNVSHCLYTAVLFFLASFDFLWTSCVCVECRCKQWRNLLSYLYIFIYKYYI